MRTRAPTPEERIALSRKLRLRHLAKLRAAGVDPALIAAYLQRNLDLTAAVPVPPPPRVPLVRKPWPEEAEAEVYRFCLNPRFALIHLPDGREAKVWLRGRRFRLGTRIKVKLLDAAGDPEYNWEEIL